MCKLWAPIALRALGIVGILLVLAAIGSVSLLYGFDGVALARGAPSASSSVGSVWIAPTDEREPQEAKAKAEAEAADAGSSPPTRTRSGVTPDGKVILNIASADELTRLPGVGAKRAAAIVKLRERLKRFRRVTDLLRVRGIGPRSLKRMKPHLVLDAPERGDGGAGE